MTREAGLVRLLTDLTQTHPVTFTPAFRHLFSHGAHTLTSVAPTSDANPQTPASEVVALSGVSLLFGPASGPFQASTSPWPSPRSPQAFAQESQGLQQGLHGLKTWPMERPWIWLWLWLSAPLQAGCGDSRPVGSPAGARRATECRLRVLLLGGLIRPQSPPSWAGATHPSRG